MKLKNKIFVLILLFSGSLSFCDTGIGGAFSYFFSTTPTDSVSVNFRQDTQPWSVWANVHLDRPKISVFVDDWIINERIAEHLDYFVFWGLSAEFLKDDDLLEISTGSRIGAGLSMMFFKRHMEVYLQGSWNPYYGIKRKKDADNSWKNSGLFRPVTFPCAAGVRFWF